jgi:RHS repeat-associated protein
MAANGTLRTTSLYNNRYTYTGREWDPDLNLYHFRARLYDPIAGRFITRDPLGFVDGMSVYRAYFGNSRVDPYGKSIQNQDDEFLDWFFRQMENNAANTTVVCVGFGGSIYYKAGGGMILNYCFDTCGNSATIGIPNAGVGFGMSLGGGATIMPGKCINHFYHCKPNWTAQGSISCVTGTLQGGFESPVPQGSGIGLPGCGVTFGPEPGVQTGDLFPTDEPKDKNKKGWGVQGAINVSIPVVLSRSQPYIRCPCPPRHPPPACNSGSRAGPDDQCHFICMRRFEIQDYDDCMEECFDRWRGSKTPPLEDPYWPKRK